MLLPGAKGNTQQEIETILQLDRPIPDMCGLFEKILDDLANHREKTIPLSNRLFIPENDEIKRAYKELIKRTFHPTTQTIDVSNPVKSADQINRWLSDKTNGMIPTLITP